MTAQPQRGRPGLGLGPVLALAEDDGPHVGEVGPQEVDGSEQVEHPLLGHDPAHQGEERPVAGAVLGSQPGDDGVVHGRVHGDAHRDLLEATGRSQAQDGPLGGRAVDGDGRRPPEGQALGRPHRSLVEGEDVPTVDRDHDRDPARGQHPDDPLGQGPVGVDGVVVGRLATDARPWPTRP